MFPTFFKHKMREVASFLQIVRGKVTGNPQDRVKGVDHALEAMNDERRVYEKEKEEALRGETSDPMIDRSAEIDKPVRESNQDISAI